MLRAIRSHKGHFNSPFNNLGASHAGAQAYIQALLGKDLFRFFGYSLVHNGQKVFHSLQQHNI